MKSLLYWIIGFFVLLGTYAVLNYNKDTEIKTVSSKPVQYTKILSAVQKNETGPIFVTFEGGATSTVPRDIELGRAQDITIVDINYDGRDDVMVEDTAGAYNWSTRFYIFDTIQKKFVSYDAFKKATGHEDEYFELGSVIFKPETKKLTSFFKGRGLGDLYSNYEYTFQDGVWYQSKTETQDLVDYKSFNSDTLYYYRTIAEYKSDHATTSSKTTYYMSSADDVTDFIEVPKSELIKRKLIK